MLGSQRTWVGYIKEQEQIIRYYVLYAHFQNYKAEKRIRDLQEQARKILLEDSICWLHTFNIHIWSYALRHINDFKTINSLDKSSPLSRFSNLHLDPILKDLSQLWMSYLIIFRDSSEL